MKKKIKSIIKKNNFCQNLFIDFDGVIVDSNLIKEKLISQSINYIDNENEINDYAIDYFNKNAGIDRIKKLEKFYEKEIVRKIAANYSKNFRKIIPKLKPTKCFIEFIEYFKNQRPNIKIYILSGGDKNEIKEFLEINKLSFYFDDILSSEKSKFEHLEFLKAKSDDIFIGDSNKDLEAAKAFNLNFILMEGYKSLESFPKELLLEKDEILRVLNFCSLLALCKEN